MIQRPGWSARAGRARRFGPWVGALLISLSAAPAWAGPTPTQRQEAKAAYAEGRKLRAEGKIGPAIERLTRAHELAPTPVTRIELARAYIDAGRLVEAEALLKTVASMPVTATETAKSQLAREDAAKLVASLGGRLPRIVVRLVPPIAGTDVTVDGKPWPADRLGAESPVDPGDHVVVALRDGRRVERPFRVAESDRLTIEIGVPEEPVASSPALPVVPRPATSPARPPTQPPARDADHHVSPLVPAAFTLSGLALATGLVTGSIALGQVGDLEAACPDGVCSADAGLDTHRALTTTSTVAFIVAGGAAAAGLVIWVADASTPAPSTVRLELRGTTIAARASWP